MKTKMNLFGLIVLTILASVVEADTFKHKSSEEVFHGFRTQKTKRSKEGTKTLVYNSEAKELMAVNLNDYVITYNTQGRRDSAIIVPITESDILLSKVVSEAVSKAIVDASNTGPQVIIVKIDNPGGRGEYMKNIAAAITQTDNCPVVAYISGGPFGGAFAGASVIALACDKIYISPTAGIGAVGTMGTAGVTDEDYAGFVKTYSPESLATYSIFVISLAQKNKRPELIVQALVNKRLSILEVTNIDGSRQFVQKDQRQPTQTIVRTLCNGIATPGTSTNEQPVQLSPADIIAGVINLSPSDAVEIGLVDQTAESLKEILAEQNVPAAQLVNSPGIDQILKKFTASKRNISEGLRNIEYMEEYAAELDEQLGEVERQMRTSTVTRELNRGTPTNSSLYRRGRVNLPEDYDDYYYDPYNNYSSSRSKRDYEFARRIPRTRSTTIEQPANFNAVYNESTLLLRELISAYRRVINLSKRWPGALPPSLPVSVLEGNMETAEIQLDRILRNQYQFQIQMQQQQQQQQPYYPSDNNRYRRDRYYR
ncbi:MAG: Clp protease/crotonase-like domain-containing protein [Planctomycetota bacterium]|jgi:ATP-dependent protease ClpP protease subunit